MPNLSAPVVAPPTGRPVWHDLLGRTAIRSAQILLVLVLAAGIVFALRQLKLIVIPVLIAAIIAAAVAPVVRWLRNRGVPNALATWIALLTGGGTLLVVVWLVVRGIRNGWDELAGSATQGLEELQVYLRNGPLEITEEQITEAREQATELLASDAVTAGAIAGATAAIEVVAGMFLGAVVLFFLIKDGRTIAEFFIRPLKPSSQVRARRIGDKSVDVLGGYVRGTAVVALVDTFFIGLALVILDVPLALPLATVVFLGAFIPLIGATLAGVLAALVALVSNGPVTALIVVAVVVLVNQLEGDLLAPVVLGKALRLHALAILLALTAGTILAGIIGALLAVPIAAVAWTVIKEWNVDRPEASTPEVTAVAT
jgi:predicted PurR-regulated permease PerM